MADVEEGLDEDSRVYNLLQILGLYEAIHLRVELFIYSVKDSVLSLLWPVLTYRWFLGALCLLPVAVFVIIPAHEEWKRSTYPLVYKPATDWSVDDVQTWLVDLGPFTEGQIRQQFYKREIDGNALLAISETTLNSSFNITDDVKIQSLMLKLNLVKELGSKPPTTFWEYKALHPRKTSVLFFWIFYSPRLTILMIYLFDYERIFLPLVHVTSPVSNTTQLNLYVDKLPRPTVYQRIKTTITTLFLPYSLIGQFIWAWSDCHVWLSILGALIALNNLLFLEIIGFSHEFLETGMNEWNRALLTGRCISWSMIVLLTPCFIGDIIFYYSLTLELHDLGKLVHRIFFSVALAIGFIARFVRLIMNG